MKEIRAYEAEGRLFKTEAEARDYILEIGLKKLFSSRDGYQILDHMVNRKDIRLQLIKLLIERDQEAQNSCQHGFTDWDDCPDCRH